MAATAAVVFGIVALDRLPLNLLPDISYPSLTLRTEYLNAAPVEVETAVTRPVEEAVGVVPGLQRIWSISRAELSEVHLEFDWGEAMQVAALEVRDKLNLVQLPDDAEQTVILRYDPNREPILRLSLTGGTNPAQRRDIADRAVKRQLESIAGIASAQIHGGLTPEVRVFLDEQRLAALGLSVSDVVDALARENVNLPGGTIKDERSVLLVRTLNEFRDVPQISQTILRQSADGTVRLGDVASVELRHREQDEITRVNGEDSVQIDLYRAGDANTVTASRAVQARLPDIQQALPAGWQLSVLSDQAGTIEAAISDVRSAALMGLVLTVLVLYFFLRHLPSTLMVGLSIPISVVATFIPMFQFGVSLNIMSFGGLALGIGMLVDCSIVVIEAISRQRAIEPSARTAAARGASEVASAVTASTLTTVAVFFPIVFVEGVAGQLFRDMALTVCFSLAASLLVSLTLIPVLASLRGSALSALAEGQPADSVLSTDRNRGMRRWLRRLVSAVVVELPAWCLRQARRIVGFFFGAFLRLFLIVTAPVLAAMNALFRVYPVALRATLAAPGAVILAGAVLFAASLALSPSLGRELIPPLSTGEFGYQLRLPEGTPLRVTAEVMSVAERELTGDPRFVRVFTTIGTLSSAEMTGETKGENLAQIQLVLNGASNPPLEAQAAADVRKLLERFPDAELEFVRPSFFSFRTPVEVQIYGDDLAALQTFSEVVAARLAAIPGLTDVRTSLTTSNPEIQIEFDRDRMASIGLDPMVVARLLRSKIGGEVATEFRRREDLIDVRVQLAEGDRDRIADLRQLAVGGTPRAPVRLEAIATVESVRGPASIVRNHQQRMAAVSATPGDRDLGSVIAEVDGLIRGLTVPPLLTVQVSGQSEEMQQSFRSLAFALALAIFLVYLVMASQFESLILPAVVIATVPLGLIGVIAGLYVTGYPVSVLSLIGTIMLAGIIVNNAIVMVDYANQRRASGMTVSEAIIHACQVRLRPIMMTTSTTILGLLPMALGLGEGNELRAPMAIAVISGLIVGTLLTLFVIPAWYKIVVRDQRAGA